MYDIPKAISAQSDYCKQKDAPHFVPRGGICYKCHKNIYQEHEKTETFFGETRTRKTGITVEKAASELVTGCPHCNISYCD